MNRLNPSRVGRRDGRHGRHIARKYKNYYVLSIVLRVPDVGLCFGPILMDRASSGRGTRWARAPLLRTYLGTLGGSLPATLFVLSSFWLWPGQSYLYLNGQYQIKSPEVPESWEHRSGVT